MNFDVGANHKLGNLNDIYARIRSASNAILPAKTFLESDRERFKSDRILLNTLPRYFSYGLVILNPNLLKQFLPDPNIPAFRNAIAAYDTLKIKHRSNLTFDDGGSQYSAKWNAQTKRRDVILPTLIDEYEEFFILPKFYALTVFGPECVDEHMPSWVNTTLVCKILFPLTRTSSSSSSSMEINEEICAKSVYDIFSTLCTKNRPPKSVDLRNIFASTLDDQNKYLTQPLQLNLIMRDIPLDQMAIVASTIFQFKSALKSFRTSKEGSHHPGGIVCLPCGSGKTKTAIAIWHGLLDDAFDTITDNNFGIIEHLDERKSSSTSKPITTMAKFLSQSNKTPSSSLDNDPYSSWLLRNPNIRNRGQKPLRTVKMLWVVHTDNLLFQAAEDVVDLFPQINIGILKGSKRPDPAKCDIVIASIDTLSSQNNFPEGYFEHFGLVVCDEAHQDLAPFFRKVFVKLACIPLILMLTATPRKYPLRWIGGPIIVSASRPFIEQQHLVILMTNVDTKKRPERFMKNWMKEKFGKNSQNSSSGKQNADKGFMIQDMVVNIERNALVVRTLLETCVYGQDDHFKIDCVDDMPLKTFKILNVNKRSDEFWKRLFDTCYRYNANTNMPQKFEASFEKDLTRENISAHYESKKHKRVPIIYGEFVQHIILLQHMFAQAWLDSAKQMSHLSQRDLRIVRLGLRQIAVVDLTNMEESVLTRMKFIGSSKQAQRSAGEHALAHSNFSSQFWQDWFSTNPSCERHAKEKSRPYPFKVDSGSKKKKLDDDNIPKTRRNLNMDDDEKQILAKNFYASDWMYYNQYFWTPIYYPLPGIKKEAAKKKSKKRKRNEDDEDEEEVTKDANLFKREELEDLRPALKPEQILATFGLLIGLGGHTAPNHLMTDAKLTLKHAHNKQALGSDFVFANYSAASTGIDKPNADTTVSVTPWGDDEQLRGRGARICETKQRVLHIEFAEPMSIFKAQTIRHIDSTQAMDVESEVYIVEMP